MEGHAGEAGVLLGHHDGAGHHEGYLAAILQVEIGGA